MKRLYVKDVVRASQEIGVELLGWVTAKRVHSQVTFLDVCDSTGVIQVVVRRDGDAPGMVDFAAKLAVESAIVVRGKVRTRVGKPSEIDAAEIELVGGVRKEFSPHPRSDVDIFDSSNTENLLNNRHMYLRNPKVMAILRFRSQLLHHMRQWFYSNEFTAIEAPILTPVPLYEDATAMAIDVHDERVFLTQCVGYYLEAAVHGFERVYNIGPSFRGEESRSKRHLMEYWHIKAEIAWMNLDEIIVMVEDIIRTLTEACTSDALATAEILGRPGCSDGLKTPFPRISYEEALQRLRDVGMVAEFGMNLGSEEEAELSKAFDRPFWVTGIPRVLEPFPYVIDPGDSRVTRVADLIASNGYGELLGVAEKIHNREMLEERMSEKGREHDPRYDFVRDVHDVGCVPHAAFGMGVERLIRWMLNIPHVRDAIPFPRTFRRKVSP
jgi:asparaginyl-tRNA synthetase